MEGSRRKKPVIINCNIGDTLTPASCSNVIAEIAKYVVCNRLIPYPYCALKNAAQNLTCVSNNLYIYIVLLMAEMKCFECVEKCRLQLS
jgi:hypothetical protein